MIPEWAWQVLSMAAGAGGVYAAIRSDLAYLRARAEGAAASAEKAHGRIDDLLMQKRGGRNA